MARKRYSGENHRKNSETVKYQPKEFIDGVIDNNVSDNETQAPDAFAGENSFGESGDLARNKKCNKCKHSCAEICCKYGDNDCNFVCDSERELLIRIICLLINKEYGLQAIEQKIRKSEQNEDIKNINSITDLLEQAIVRLGETALGAVEKAVDAAGTMSDITSGLAKIAAGAAGTAGSIASTAQGLANTAAGTAGAVAAGAATVGAAADVAAETAGLAAVGAATVGVAGDIAAEAAGLAAASAATVGVAGDIATEAAGLATASAATVGVAGDIAAEAAGLAAAGAATAGAAADILAEEAGAAAAISSTTASAADIAANVASTTATASGTVAGIAGTVSGAAGTAAAISSTAASVADTAANVAATTAAAAETSANVAATTATIATTVPVVLDNELDTIQICLINNDSKPSEVIRIIMNNLSDSPKTSSYEQSLTVLSTSAVFLTVTLAPAEYEVQINGLSQKICAYFVLINRANNILSSQTPVEAKVLYVFPCAGK